MIEHHVETAFNEHAKLRGCTKFNLDRKDRPDLGIVDKISKGDEDITIIGDFIWNDRQFQFLGRLNTGGFAGTVLIQASAKSPVMLASVGSASYLAERFEGYGLVIDKPTKPGQEDLGYFFWGINSKVCDMGFDEGSVNAICFFLDAALTNFEESKSNKADR